MGGGQWRLDSLFLILSAALNLVDVLNRSFKKRWIIGKLKLSSQEKKFGPVPFQTAVCIFYFLMNKVISCESLEDWLLCKVQEQLLHWSCRNSEIWVALRGFIHCIASLATHLFCRKSIQQQVNKIMSLHIHAYSWLFIPKFKSIKLQLRALTSQL